MTANHNNRKQLIDFLINRWQLITGFAALERVYIATCDFAKTNGTPIPEAPSFTIPLACRQIEVIKHRIIEILPEANFIDYNYEAQAPLDPHDFVEVYVADHQQCISKVEEVVNRMKIK